jgi:hypothetical protein
MYLVPPTTIGEINIRNIKPIGKRIIFEDIPDDVAFRFGCCWQSSLGC